MYGKCNVGNVKDKSLREIWFGREFQAIRDTISRGRRNFSACKDCDSLIWHWSIEKAHQTVYEFNLV